MNQGNRPAPDTRLEYTEISKNIYIEPAKPIIDKAYKNFECSCKIEDECGEECSNRDGRIECGDNCVCGDACQNKNFEKGSRFKLERIEYDNKGYGVASTEVIPKGSFIIEFVGEVVTNEEKIRRNEKYDSEGKTVKYFMQLKSNLVFDATNFGNLARFLNHSHDANALFETWYVNGEVRMGIFSTVKIQARTEICIDYKVESVLTPPPCFNNAEKCTGFMWEKKIDKKPLEKPEKPVEDESFEGDSSNATSNESTASSGSPAKSAEESAASSASPGKSEEENKRESSNGTSSTSENEAQGGALAFDFSKLDVSGKKH